ncbi:hypothetical protein E2C01_080207 [Portunus trituberculatus]|uniref:Uncharacterized protein n=1 Tax=Portunus trituberculatus TaxID=210409 RepID=A0A5B7IIZ6_PORTR|nr:hypothetical protein [Portunus trituberculatus]
MSTSVTPASSSSGWLF